MKIPAHFLCLLSLAAFCAAAAVAAPPPPRPEEYDGGRIIDITHYYRDDMPLFRSENGIGQILSLPKSMKNGYIGNESELRMGVHTGTHVDAPGHVFDRYFDAGFDVDALDLSVINGPALLVDVPRDQNITGSLCGRKNVIQASLVSRKMEHSG